MPCFLLCVLLSLWEQIMQTVFYLIAEERMRLGEVKTLPKVIQLGCVRLAGNRGELGEFLTQDKAFLPC